jgi:hypothetical protein
VHSAKALNQRFRSVKAALVTWEVLIRGVNLGRPNRAKASSSAAKSSEQLNVVQSQEDTETARGVLFMRH